MSNDINYEPPPKLGCLDKILIALTMVISALFFRNPNPARRKRRG